MTYELMTERLGASARGAFLLSEIAGAACSALERLRERLKRAAARRSERHELLSLPAHQLRDLGLDRMHLDAGLVFRRDW
ncbi:DUF1127 domain-containing protein [Minwuia thermotolerans]|uniref:YjiS-like domain-containing protein n=1 Tax=Minwuia thermotolerans TaxID=2056226 RepID=A0A2M9FXK8_9PROT|nr:DUF1127 domain-containing protein [Minwuia thermotolerans]PJK28202.1 hypothetical protein CVT23_17645 [Minwuia thermotolerans]